MRLEISPLTHRSLTAGEPLRMVFTRELSWVTVTVSDMPG